LRGRPPARVPIIADARMASPKGQSLPRLPQVFVVGAFSAPEREREEANHEAAHVFVRAAAAIALSVSAVPVAAKVPRDLTFIVPYGAGSTDPISRQFASQMEKELGRNIAIQNKPGAAARWAPAPS
jgi:hypothetical protein